MNTLKETVMSNFIAYDIIKVNKKVDEVKDSLIPRNNICPECNQHISHHIEECHIGKALKLIG